MSDYKHMDAVVEAVKNGKYYGELIDKPFLDMLEACKKDIQEAFAKLREETPQDRPPKHSYF